MSALRAGNRAMFWRIVRRLLGANRGRLFVILLALGTGATVTAALLNLQVDAKRRITTEFRAFGANVVIAPLEATDASLQSRSSTMPDNLLQHLPVQKGGGSVPAAGFLYVTADINAFVDESVKSERIGSSRAVLTGFRTNGQSPGDIAPILPYRVLGSDRGVVLDTETCDAGEKVASQLRLHFSALIKWQVNDKQGSCVVEEVRSFGSAEDDQIFLTLDTVQELAQLPHRLSLIQLNVPGTPEQIEAYVALLRDKLPGVDVHPVRQFTEAQSKIYMRILGLLNFTVAIVLVLTGLCVMAAMTNVAMERRNDVGLMKAIGGATRRVLRLFMMEAALLGLAGGLIGAAAGIFLSIWLGKQVFGVAAQPRLIVYPVSVALTTIVAILSAYPLRRLASVRPASVFRGEA